MTKAERVYYDRGYRAGKKKSFDDGWKSAHDEFEDYLKKEHYDKGYSAGKKAGEAEYAALEAKVLKQDQATSKDAYNKGYSAGRKQGREESHENAKKFIDDHLGEVREKAYGEGCDDAVNEYKKSEAYAEAINAAFKNGSENSVKKYMDATKQLKHAENQLKHADKALAEQETWFNRKIKILYACWGLAAVLGFVIGYSVSL